MRRVEYFFNFIASPTANEFLQNTKDIRLGYLAAISLYHMADYWANENNKKIDLIISELSQENPDFLVIRDVANASKHNILYFNKNDRIISSSKQITRPPGLFNAPFGEAVLGPSDVIIIFDSKEEHLLEKYIRSVLEMWEKKLESSIKET